MREVRYSIETWEMKAPFKITGHVFTKGDFLHVTLKEDGEKGCGEAAGVYYCDEDDASMLAQAESVRKALEQGADRQELRRLLPSGGARNAIDCALWDLEAKLAGRRIWELVGIELGEVTTVNTVGIGTLDEMARTAKAINTDRIKVKLSDELPLERIAAVCTARPDAEIIVDVNQGWSFEQLVELAPRFKDLGVTMIEQPLPRGGDEALEDYDSPVVLCADESCLDTTEFEQAARRYQMINIKLDKTGGLTEALDLAAMAKARGIEVMVGNMLGTSLAMAPGFVVAQLCRFVDLDGALFLKEDREYPMSFTGGVVSSPRAELWG